MILGPISYVDCFVFIIFLAPRLVIDVGLWSSALCGLEALPFLALKMPVQLIHERYFTSAAAQSPFVQQASLFQDIVIRCVRYAFANIPANVGAVFLSKPVSHPWMRWRMLRHGLLQSPLHYEEIHRPGIEGVWIIDDPEAEPDVVLYYAHGGGFSMGSTYFYLEFLMTWCTLLKDTNTSRFRNPAVFALEYTLVPTKIFPAQLQETRRGYDFVLEKVLNQDAQRIVVAGDSAGATLMMSLLLDLAEEGQENKSPGFATLISPWCLLVSRSNQNTRSDYLNAESLHTYARQYVGAHPHGANESIRIGGSGDIATFDPIASPGRCQDEALWKLASPRSGFHFIFGAEEVFAPSARELSKTIQKAGVVVEVTEEPGGIHAWPVVSLFLKDSKQDRLHGLHKIVDIIGIKMPR